MAIVAGFDVHRARITWDAVDTDTGAVTRGRIESTPAAVGRSVARFADARIDVAVEACTGWLFVCGALAAAGATAHLAEPVEGAARAQALGKDRPRGRPLAARVAGRRRLPEAWIPPEHVRQWLRHTLIGERTQWMRRIQATLFHYGIHGTPEKLRAGDGRAFLQRIVLPPDARERIAIALAMIDAIEAQPAPRSASSVSWRGARPAVARSCASPVSA